MNALRKSILSFGLCLQLALAVAVPLEKEKVTVFFSGETARYSISSIRKDGVHYISIEEFSDLLGMMPYTNPQNKKTMLQCGKNTLKITASNPFLVLNDVPLQMALPPLDVDGKTFVPLHLFLEATKSFFPVRFFFDAQNDLLRVSKINENITGLQISEMGNGTVIRLVTTRPFKPAEVSASIAQGWLSVTLYGGIVDSAYLATTAESKIVKQVVPYQFDGSAYIKFKLDRETSDKKVDVTEDAVIVSLWNSRSADKAATFNPSMEREKWRIDRIVIDPGHGGRDPGAIGPSKLKEKEVTIDIAVRLKSLLKNRLPNVAVLLTRENDMFLGLKERTQFANANSGKLFISIHVDANPDRSIRGFSTYFLGVSKTQDALEVAQKENSVVKMEESSEMYQEFQDASYILNSIAQSSFLKESQDLAQMVNLALRTSTKIPDQGVHQAGFYVLIGAAMPSVLIENGFLSNPHEERLLKTRSFLQKVAEGLCDSVCQFKKRYEKEFE